MHSVVKGAAYGLYHLRGHLLQLYVLIPIGLLVEFTILYGLNQLIVQIFKIKFPASVMGMLGNLVILCTISFASKYWPRLSKVLSVYMDIILPSMNFCLKWINIFFIPSFVILPLSKPITIIEVLKIAAVFVVGWWLLLLIDVYFIKLLRIIFLNKRQLTKDVELDDLRDARELEVVSVDIQVPEKSYQRHGVNLIIDSRIRPNPFEGSVSTTLDTGAHTPSTVQNAPGTAHDSAGHTTENSRASLDSGSSGSSDLPGSSDSPEAESPEHLAFAQLDPTAKRAAVFTTNYIDWVLYGLLLVASLPLFFIPQHIYLPFHLSITILAYYIALLIPVKWPVTKKFAHPILVSVFLILFVCFITSMIFHRHPKGFLTDLKFYKTGKNYLNLFSHAYLIDNGETNTDLLHETEYPIWPGCGDFLSSLMDISIVALSLPMFNYRRDFAKNWWIMFPILVSMALTFFIYPLVCYHIGISSTRSIGFIGRSVTLALGTPLIDSLNGSISLMAVCTILSGICGVLIGDYVFKLLRIKENDYVTRGVSLGINCGAIATAHLLNVDPRAASMSSLSFTIFGTVMIIFASIGDIRAVVQSLVHL